MAAPVLFDIAKSDASILFLTRIFGNMGMIPIPEKYHIGEINLLSEMFRVFNGVILTVGALMVVYTTVTGVMITAHEGEFMGKKYHQIWTPLRTLIGIVVLIPMYTGYSAIQLVMMWIIIQGIGAADVMWGTVIDFVERFGSPYAQLTVTSSASATALDSVFQALVCSYSATMDYDKAHKLDNNGNYYCAKVFNGPCPPSGSTYTAGMTRYDIGPGGICGTLTSCDQSALCSADANSLQCIMCKAQQEQLSGIISTLDGIAKKFVDVDYTYRDFYQHSATQTKADEWGWIYAYCASKNIPQNQCCVPLTLGEGMFGTDLSFQTDSCKAQGGASPYLYSDNNADYTGPSAEAVGYIYYNYGDVVPKKDDFMGTIMDAYTETMNEVARDKLAEIIRNAPKTIDPKLEEARDNGWIFAGSYYYLIGEMNNTNNLELTNGVSLTFDLQESDPTSKYRNNRDAALTLADMAAGVSPAQNKLGIGKAGTQVGRTTNDVSATLKNLGSSASNPIAQMQLSGSIMLLIVQAAFIALLIIALSAGLGGNISVYVLGTGVSNPIGPAYITISMLIVPAVLALFGVMITLGGMLAVYVPLIPYIIFTFGVIGWFITTLEAMVAGPLVALGILSPSGQHEILGKAEPALMLIFSIFLRPTLMIFGLMAAMLLASAVADMINLAFWGNVLHGIIGGGVGAGEVAGPGASPLQLIIFLCAYVMVIVSAMNKCFSAIHVIPERVMAWIGGQAAQTGGESEAVGEMKGGASAGAGGAKGAMSGTASQGKGAGKARAKYEEKGEAQTRKKFADHKAGVSTKGKDEEKS